RPHNSHPILNVTLTFTHAGFRRLVGNRFVGEDANPHFATAPQGADDGATSGFDLAGGDPTGLQRLQAPITESDGRATLGFALHPAAHLLAPLNTFWHQHSKY